MKTPRLDAQRASKRVAEKRTVVGDSLTELRDSVAGIRKIRVDSVIIGPGYTAVKLSSGHVGLAHSLLEEQVPRCCELMRRAGHLAGSEALHLARLSLSWDMRSRVVGVATINALSQLSLERHPAQMITTRGDIANQLRVKGSVVTVVGNIAPTVRKLRGKARRIYILERTSDLRDEGTLPDTAAEEIIPQSDVVLITGTSIVNGTVDRLLQLSINAKTVALIGPTAGAPPTVLFEHGATIVGTVRVKKPELAMRIVAEGGGTHSLAEAVEFVVYKLSPARGVQ